jgi:hypothetical protein
MGWTRQEVLDVARSTGRPVVEAWSSHNAGLMGTVVGPMLHHTGSTWSYPGSKAPTLRTVREGRSDLQNALCMYYIDYEGVIYCITEKIAWHAGGGSWQGVTDGNGHYAGIEAESDGRQWTPATVDSYKRLAAAILRKAGRGIGYAPRHGEYALPPGRKTDFTGMDATAFRADVNALINNPGVDDMDIGELYNARDGNGRNFLDFQNFLTGVVGELNKTLQATRAEVAELKASIGQGGSGPVDVKAVAEQLTVVPKG